ncbi:MAG: hypothetical protein HWN67_06150 [Candidatus Helarchaeota archaeon]|nr:hypothetical protein [Candidatus Helarchaeota archaeon]
MPKKFHWDLVRALILIGGILGILFSILITLEIMVPIVDFITHNWVSRTVEIIICIVIIIGYGVLGWDIWDSRETTFLCIIFGIVLIVLFGNLAGIPFIIAGIIIPFGS